MNEGVPFTRLHLEMLEVLAGARRSPGDKRRAVTYADLEEGLPPGFGSLTFEHLKEGRSDPTAPPTDSRIFTQMNALHPASLDAAGFMSGGLFKVHAATAARAIEFGPGLMVAWGRALSNAGAVTPVVFPAEFGGLGSEVHIFATAPTAATDAFNVVNVTGVLKTGFSLNAINHASSASGGAVVRGAATVHWLAAGKAPAIP